MRYVFKKMADKIPHRFFWFNIFLAATMAEPALYMDMAIKAVPPLSFFKTAHLH